MRPWKLIIPFLLSCITLLNAQQDAENLQRPTANSANEAAFKSSIQQRIQFEYQLLDSMLYWTDNMECTYRIAGFLSACNEQLLLNRAHWLQKQFNGDRWLLEQYFKERIYEILLDSEREDLYYSKMKTWDRWIQKFISWLPQLQSSKVRLVNTPPAELNPFKHFSYYGIPIRN